MAREASWPRAIATRSRSCRKAVPLKVSRTLSRLALARSGVPAAESAYVGDSPVFDTEPAEALGMRGVLIDRRGRHPRYRGQSAVHHDRAGGARISRGVACIVPGADLVGETAARFQRWCHERARLATLFGRIAVQPQFGVGGHTNLEFRDGRGEFYSHEDFNGRMVVVRFVITATGPDSCHFEQSFSDDGGKTWEVNWIAVDTRVKNAN